MRTKIKQRFIIDIEYTTWLVKGEKIEHYEYDPKWISARLKESVRQTAGMSRAFKVREVPACRP